MTKIQLDERVMDLRLDLDDRLEKFIQRDILKYLRSVKDIECFKVAPTIYSDKGIADIIACYKERFIALECKTAKGKPRPLQVLHLNRVVAAGGISALARSVADAKYVIKEIDNASSR